jgi:hypothetical protein
MDSVFSNHMVSDMILRIDSRFDHYGENKRKKTDPLSNGISADNMHCMTRLDLTSQTQANKKRKKDVHDPDDVRRRRSLMSLQRIERCTSRYYD